VLDVGCGPVGWLAILGDWVGPEGEVVGTDIEPSLLEAAQSLGLENVRLVEDDLFATQLEPDSFDLVHARLQLTPIGRHDEQLDVYTRVAKPGGVLVLEDPDSSAWRLQPEGAATAVLIEAIRMAFKAGGGDFDTGRYLPHLLVGRGIEPHVTTHVLALGPEHPYLRCRCSSPVARGAAARPPRRRLRGARRVSAARDRGPRPLGERRSCSCRPGAACPSGHEALDVLREHVDLEVHRVARRERAERRHLERVRDERDLERVVVQRGDRERDAVERDRALLDAVAEDLLRRLDGESRSPSNERTRPTPSTWPCT
jgi:SAM-dependent methyltransferase